MSKSAYKSYDYQFPSGKTIRLQGYEKYAIKILLQNFKEDDIITNRDKVPEVWFYDENGKKHRYFIDIFILSQNKGIEVKSVWTLKKNNVFLKQEAFKDHGYICEIWIINDKGELLEII